MPDVRYTLIHWSDDNWSFEEIDPATGAVIFASHLDYPLYICRFDALHAITICEHARAHVHGHELDDFTAEVVLEKRPRWQRVRDQARAEARLTRLLRKARRVYTKREFVIDRFGPAAA